MKKGKNKNKKRISENIRFSYYFLAAAIICTVAAVVLFKGWPHLLDRDRGQLLFLVVGAGIHAWGASALLRYEDWRERRKSSL